MDPAFQAELDRQQSNMLEKLSSIIDNKLDSMKRQLEESSNTQMSELKKIRLTESRTFKKKGHEQQFKHNQLVKSVVSEAKDAVNSGKQDACIAKLNEGIELIDRRQKLILIADKSEYGWKTVGEYLDNELADNDQDAKKNEKGRKRSSEKTCRNARLQGCEGSLLVIQVYQSSGKHSYFAITKLVRFPIRKLHIPFFTVRGCHKKYRSICRRSRPETWHVFQLR